MKKEGKIVIRFLGLVLLWGILTGGGTQVDAEYALQVLIRAVKQKKRGKKNIIMMIQKDEAERGKKTS